MNINNQKEFNTFASTNLSLRSGHAINLEGKIEKLNNLNNISKVLNTKTNEINKIINTKDSLSNLNSQIILEKNTNKNLSLYNILVSNTNKGLSKLNYSNLNHLINKKGKYFSIGNKPMSLNIFLKNFNINQIETNTEICNKNYLRHYLNSLTNFEYKLANSNFNLYKFNKTNKQLFVMQKASNFLNLSFNSMGCFISKPSFNLIYTNNKIENNLNNNLNINLNTLKIVINLFYYVKTTQINGSSLPLDNNAKVLTDQFEKNFLFLTDYLTKLFNHEVELNLVRLYQPYQDSNILVQYLNSDSYNNKFIKLISKLFKNINLNNSSNKSNLLSNETNSQFSYPSNISGVNIRLAGRPLNERIIPRLTVKRAQRGSFNRLNAKLITKSMFTDKTRKGAFNFTVTLSQNFN